MTVMSACRMRYFYHAEIYLPSQLIDSGMVSGYWVWVELLGHRCLRCDGKLMLELHWVRDGFHFLGGSVFRLGHVKLFIPIKFY